MNLGLMKRRAAQKPSLYDEEIQYLDGTGGQWIDSLISRGNSFSSSEFILDLQFTNISGRQIQGSGSGYYCGVNNGKWETDYQQYKGNADTNRHIYRKKLTKESNRSYFYTYLDGNLLYTWNWTYTDDHFGGTIGLFRLSNNTYNYCKMRLYGAKIYLNNALVRDYIPVRKGQVGYMYDKVSGQLFGNSGTGNFILGPDK